MKKLFLLLASLVLMASLLFVNSCGPKPDDQGKDPAPEHTHAYVEGKCECGESDPNYVPPHEHNFVEGKCECGESDPDYVPLPNPAFSQSEYVYDRLGGGALELPIDLDGAGFFYLQINGEIVNKNSYYFDEEKKAIVVSEDYILTLPLGSITVVAITDAETEEPVSCTVSIEQSLKTSFDEETTRHFVYGKDSGVSFSVGYNGTTPKKLLIGNTEIDSKYYSYDESTFTLKAESLSHYSETTEYTLVLSNNDAYKFSVSTNMIFATDYDIVTQHNTHASNIGLNPLYQYYDNVSIVDGPEGMSGKVLKITPNTTDVTYDCHGYITIRASWWDSTWQEVSFTKGKYYVVSFDYMTEGTSVGDFCVRGVNSSTWREDLLLGAENDGKLHHFSTIVSMEQLKDGLYVWAKFIGGGGNVYIDNYKVAQLDAAPELGAGKDYSYKSGDSYSLAFDPAGLSFEVLLNGERIDAEYNAIAKLLIIPADVMATLEPGVHTVEVTTPATSLRTSLRIVDNRVAQFSAEKTTFDYNTDSSVKVYGSFDSTISLVSLKQVDKVYDNGYSGGWEFAHADTEKNYASLVNFSPALDGAGYIEIPKSVAELFWGETEFVAEFSNGVTHSFVLNSENVPFFTNYDDTTIRGQFNGGWKDSPLESGMWGGAQFGVEQVDGDSALYIRSTAGAADTCAFSIRMHTHPWEWYNVHGTEGNYYRVTFEYQISSDLSDVYFYIMSPHAEDQNAAFLGDYDQFDDIPWDQYYKVRFNLIADGEKHTFDSGWFSYNPSLRMFKIQMPSFEATEGRFVMIDDYRVVTTDSISYLPANLGGYSKGQSEAYGFALNGASVSSVTLNGEALAYEIVDGFLSLNKDALEAKAAGEYKLAVTTDKGIHRKNISITDNRVSTLNKTSKIVVYGKPAKLAGEFDTTLKVISINRYGADNVWDNGGNAVAMNPAYITITADGLVLAQELIDQVYKTARFEVLLSNGKTIEFSLTTNIIFYSNYDETNIYPDIPGNSVTGQDAAMRESVAIDGNKMLKYTPANAVEWHSTQAINGNGADNFFLTFENRTVNNWNWYDLYLSTADTLIVTFKYEVVLGEGKESHFLFTWLDMAGAHHTTKLEGSGTFYVELPLSECKAFGINCPVASPDMVAGSYMLLDNLGIGTVAPDTIYLSETSKNVVYGATEPVLLEGEFDGSLTIVSLTRSGENFWDEYEAAVTGQPVQISTDYVKLTANCLEISPALINMLYGKQTFRLTLSNGDVVKFELTSNMLHYTNYDDVSVHEASEGNIRSCQDTAMRQLLDDNGDKFIRYTPANAVYGHSVNGGNDNGIFTFSNTTLDNTWWWEYGLPVGSKLIVTFDYKVVLGEGLDNYFRFWWRDANGADHFEVIEGEGTFTITLNSDDVQAFRIYCPSGSNAAIQGSYMDIDNFGFGIVAE